MKTFEEFQHQLHCAYVNADEIERRCYDAECSLKEALDGAESAEFGCEIAYKREPTQEEADANANGADECFIPMGGWTARRCRHCRIWVFGGPTACVRCVERNEKRELQAQLENVLDSHVEGAWMARALGAEQNLKELRSVLNDAGLLAQGMETNQIARVIKGRAGDGSRLLKDFLQKIADTLNLELPSHCDHVLAIQLDIRRLQDVERRWSEACELASTHCPVSSGRSHIREGIPALAEHCGDLRVALASSVMAMRLWGAEEGGIPEEGPIAQAYEHAEALLRKHEGPSKKMKGSDA